MKQAAKMYLAKRTDKSTQSEHCNGKNYKETKIRLSKPEHGEEAENKEAKKSKSNFATPSQRSGSRTQRYTVQKNARKFHNFTQYTYKHNTGADREQPNVP